MHLVVYVPQAAFALFHAELAISPSVVPIPMPTRPAPPSATPSGRRQLFTGGGVGGGWGTGGAAVDAKGAAAGSSSSAGTVTVTDMASPTSTCDAHGFLPALTASIRCLPGSTGSPA